MGEYGRVVPPYGGVTRCADADCASPELGETFGAYLHQDTLDNKLRVFCGPCSMNARMNYSLRFPLVAI